MVKNIRVFLLSSALGLLWGCGGEGEEDPIPEEAPGVRSSSNAMNRPAQPAEPSLPHDGASLYAIHCSSCHLGIEGSQVENRSIEQINQAMTEVVAMSHLKLSPGEISLIAAALQQGEESSDPMPGEGHPQGEHLYHEHCESCHGSLGSSTKRSRSSDAIQMAVNNIQEMVHLNHLSGRQILLIAGALGSPVSSDSNDNPADQVGTNPEGPMGAIDGSYQQHCGACHGALSESSKRGRTLEQLNQAIRNEPTMSHLKELQDPVREAIIRELSETPPLESSRAPDGISLYKVHCESCHGDLTASTKRNRSASQIKLAITAVEAMKGLAGLDDGELDAIASALKKEEPKGEPPPEATPQKETGQSLYASHCAACHGSLASSQKLGATQMAITSAIQSVASMQTLRFLTTDQVGLIAASLKDFASPKRSQDLTGRSLMGLEFVESQFTVLFVNDRNSRDRSSISRIIRDEITSQRGIFQGYCTPYDDGCSDAPYSLHLSPSSSLRQSRIIRACEGMLGLTGALENFLIHLGMTPSDNPDLSQIRQAYKLFAHHRGMGGEGLMAYQSLMNSGPYQMLPAEDRWRVLLNPICKNTLGGML